MPAAPSRTLRMIPTGRLQNGQSATFAPGRIGTTRIVPLQRRRKVDGLIGRQFYPVPIGDAVQAAPSCGGSSQACADLTGPSPSPVPASLNGTTLAIRSCQPSPKSCFFAANVTTISAV